MIKTKIIIVMLLICFLLSSCSSTISDDFNESSKEQTDFRFNEIELSIPELDQITHEYYCPSVGSYLEDGSFRILSKVNNDQIEYYESLDYGQTWEKREYKIGSVKESENYHLMSLNFALDGTIVSSGYEIFPEQCEANNIFNTSLGEILYKDCGTYNIELYDKEKNQRVSVNLPENSNFSNQKDYLINVQYYEGMIYGVTEQRRILVEIDPSSGNVEKEIFSINGSAWGDRYYLLGDVIVVDRNVGYEFFNRITGEKYNCPKDIQSKIGIRQDNKAIFTRGLSKEEIVFIGVDGIYRYDFSKNILEQIISANENILSDRDRENKQLFAVNDYEYYVISRKNEQLDMHCFKYERNVVLSSQESYKTDEIEVDTVIEETNESEFNTNSIKFSEKELPCPLSYSIYLPQNWIKNGTYLGDGHFRLFNFAHENQITYYESYDYGKSWELISYEPEMIDSPMNYWTLSVYFSPDGTIVTAGYEVVHGSTDPEKEYSLNNTIHIGDGEYKYILEIRDDDQKRYVDLNLPKIPEYNYGMEFLTNVQYCDGLLYGVTETSRILVELDSETGEVTREVFKSDYWTGGYYVLGDVIVVDNVWKYEFYNRITGKKYECPEDVNNLMGIRDDNKAVFTRGFSEEEIIFLGIDGIYRYDLSKNIAEQIVSDEYNTLSKDEYDVRQLYAINENEYYIVGIKNDDNSYIHSVVYDETLSISPQNHVNLKVYVDEEDMFVQECVDKYLLNNPSVTIEYVDENEIDHADIYFYKRYKDVEKEQFKDFSNLSEIVERVNTTEGLFEDIVYTTKNNNVISLVPVRVSTWVLVGNINDIDNYESLDAIVSSVTSNGDILLYDYVKDDLKNRLLDVYEHSYLKGDKLNKKDYEKILNQFEILESSESVSIEGFAYKHLFTNQYSAIYDSVINQEIDRFLIRSDQYKNSVDWIELKTMGDYVYLTNMLQENLLVNANPTYVFLENTCTPNMFVATNKSADSAASDFVEFVLSSEAQNIWSGGLPVNKQGLQQIEKLFIDKGFNADDLYKALNEPGNIGYMDDYLSY